jgi:hypothetical protein
MNRMSDADILIVDPSIPLHSLIPVDDIRPNANPPLILGNEDKNGFNAGNMLFRVHIDLIYFLSHTFALADDTTKAYYNASAALGYLVKEGKNQIIETPPSDQKSMCLLMHKDKTFGSRFYQYPPRWLNWYESRWDDGTDSTATAGAMTRTRWRTIWSFNCIYIWWRGPRTGLGWTRMSSASGSSGVSC